MEFIDLGAQLRRVRPEVDRAIGAVLDHGRYILGPEVEQLERSLSSFSGAEHVVTCGNGTDALLLSLQALGMEPGDVVFVPAFTFAATAEAVAYLGGIPCFVDVRPDTFNLDVSALTEVLLTKADLRERAVGIIPVDLFGHPADYQQCERVAAEFNLWVLADAAQSFGATCGNTRVGTMGDVTITSFFPAKPLGAYGDGGAVLTDNESLAGAVRSLRVHGQGSDKYENIRVGMNSRLDSIQAAVLIEKLKIFGEELGLRRQIANAYRDRLQGVVTPPEIREEVNSAWAQFTVILPQDTDRSVVQTRMKKHDVPTAVYYEKPLHRQAAYAAFPRQFTSLPVAEDLADRVLSLPMHPYLTDNEVSHVCDCLIAALQAA